VSLNAVETENMDFLIDMEKNVKDKPAVEENEGRRYSGIICSTLH